VLSYGVVDPVLDGVRVETVVVVMTAAIPAPVAHVGHQPCFVTLSLRMGVQEDGADGRGVTLGLRHLIAPGRRSR
jgi:hypothetical protein